MERQKIEQYAKQVLTFCGVERQDVSRQVYDCLCHLLVAMKHLDLMNEEDRAFMMDFVELRMNFYLNAKLVIKEKNKERKRKKQKKSLPPHSLPIEKENKEKEEKGNTHTIRDAKEVFRLECMELLGKYSKDEVTKFYEWYTQKDDDGVMLFETERRRKGWNTKTRMKRWLINKFTLDDKAAAVRLKKAQGAPQADTAQQRAIAAERERANAEAERQREADKAGAVSREEWEAMKKQREKGGKA